MMIETTTRNVKKVDPGGATSHAVLSQSKKGLEAESQTSGLNSTTIVREIVNNTNKSTKPIIKAVQNKMDARYERNDYIDRDQSAPVREDISIIDLTSKDEASFQRGMDPDAFDAHEWFSDRQERDGTSTDGSAISQKNLVTESLDPTTTTTETKNYISSNRIRDVTELVAKAESIEQRRKKLFEKFEASKFKAEKAKVFVRSMEDQEANKNTESYDPLRDSLPPVPIGSTDRLDEKRIDPSGNDMEFDNSNPKLSSVERKATVDSACHEELVSPIDTNVSKNDFEIKTIEITEESNVAAPADEESGACHWYLCSGDSKVSSTENPEPNDSNPMMLENQPAESTLSPKLCHAGPQISSDQDFQAKETEETCTLPSEIPTSGIWKTLVGWIDPDPESLLESVRVYGGPINSNVQPERVDVVVEETREINQVNLLDPPPSEETATAEVITANEGRVDASPASEYEQDFNENDFDQESVMISDAGLNSIPAKLNTSQDHGSFNVVKSSTISAFEPVKPKAPSPAASLESISAQEEEDEEEAQGSNNFTENDASHVENAEFIDDIHSIHSVKPGVQEEVSFIPEDDMTAAPQDSSPLRDENRTDFKPSETTAFDSSLTRQLDVSPEFPIESLGERRQFLMKELRTSVASYGRYDVRCAKLSAALGEVLGQLGDHTGAVRLHKDAVTVYSCKLGEDNTTTMDAKIRLGNSLENTNKYDEAVSLYHQITVMRRSLHGENDQSVADGLVLMSQALRKKSDFLPAIKELKRALKIYRESLGDVHEKVASTVDQIASLYVTVGDFEKSAAILEEVVKLKAATSGMKSLAVAHTLSNLATSYECSEKFDDAMKALKKAYKIHSDLGGLSSEESTSILNRIAQLYEATGDQNRASIAYLGVLRARKILKGSDSMSVGETYFRLGHSLRETGQYDKALKCLKEALPIFVGQGVEVNDLKMVADIMHEMAFTYQDKGSYQDAVRIFKQELSVRRKIGQPEYPLVARTLNHLGVAEFELENNNRALKYLVEALSIFQERGEQGIECAEVLFNTGLVFDAVDNKERALEAYIEAARIFQEYGYDEQHPHLLKATEKIKKVSNELKTQT